MDSQARELEALYETRYLSFRNALATVTGSRESARDAVQEALARALAGHRRRRARHARD
jgi:DNA-directed RNA polymerase specialized sigma24 family protein